MIRNSVEDREGCLHGEDLPVPVILASIGRNAIRLMNEALEPTGLKPRHIPTLMALTGGPLTQAALAEATSADATTLVGLLNDLELESLVMRQRDPADRRRHIVALSEIGRQRLEAMKSATRRVESRLLAGLDHAQVAYLRTLLHHLSKTTSPAAPCSNSQPPVQARGAPPPATQAEDPG